ncbi:alanine racemase [Patescibacteria group bacterium]|nr:alanine racemase [Patescibacteria group bacterium]
MARQKTFVSISRKAVRNNARVIRRLISPKVRLWSVVKSNAYGHGLVAFAQIADPFVDGFCVDSVPEGLKLRAAGITKPILVLGPTLLELFGPATENNITISISNAAALRTLAKSRRIPEFHIKIDTGMHRQGFLLSELPSAIRTIKKNKKLSAKLKGIFTHFASAKDINYPTYTDLQFDAFMQAADLFRKAGFTDLIRHTAATGGMLVSKKYHLDAVRIGIGFYGLWPSKELEMQKKDIRLAPVLSWHALVSEVKSLKKGDYVGYDLVDRLHRSAKVAIVPIGYWHGFPRSLSSGAGEVLINGKHAPVLGRVSMDLLIVDVSGIRCAVGDTATLIGRQKTAELSADAVARKSGTTHYEFLTRINPLIERKIM